MLKLASYIIFCFLVLNTFSAKAQGEDSSYVTFDTSIQQGSYEDLLNVPTVVEEKESVFDTISKGDKIPVSERSVDENKLTAIKKDKDFWYANEVPKREKPKEPGESTLNKISKKEWFRNLMWFIIVGGFISVLIWFLISSDIQLFKKAPSAIPDSKDEFEARSIFDIDYENEIQQAVSRGDFKLAIRLQYLQTLKEMSERNIIKYKQELTNNDYLVQLYNTVYYKEFFKLTRVFEYAWYGQFPVSANTYEIVRNDFFTFKQRFNF